MKAISNCSFSISFYSITMFILLMPLCNLKLYSSNNFVLQGCHSIGTFYEIRTLHDTCKTILVYSVNNITDKTVAKIEIKTIVRGGELINAVAKVIENKIDSVNSVTGLVLSMENGFLILQVKMNANLECPNKNQYQWVGDMEASIFLVLTKAGYLKALTLNSNPEDWNLRFGGDFLDQSKGIFKTKSVCLR